MFLACASDERGSCYMETHVGSAITSVINLQRKQDTEEKMRKRGADATISSVIL